MEKFLLIVCLFISFGELSSQNIIALQPANGSSASFYTDVQSAVNAASNGDYIYLPGGPINISPSLNINKRISLIGAGFFNDSTLATHYTELTGAIYLLAGADGSTISGISASTLTVGTDGATQNVNNVTISRCSFNLIQLGYTVGVTNGSGRNFLISECVLGQVYGNNMQHVKITKCIIGSGVSSSYRAIMDFNYNAEISNCIILTSSYCGSGCLGTIENINGCIIQNNIFYSTQARFTNCYNNIVLNNTFCNDGSINAGGGPGNLYNVNQATLFVDAPPLVPYSQLYDYHVQTSSVAHNYGTDGTDVGIYGTSIPYKEGSVPFNPHIQLKNISSATDLNGNLPVNIKVAAQSR